MILMIRGSSAAGPKPGRASFCGELGSGELNVASNILAAVRDVLWR